MSRQLMLVAMTLTAVGCGEAEEQPPAPEPLVLPEEPAESGVPVGVRTEDWGGTEVEVWYPASDATTGASEAVDFNRWMPASVEALLGPVDLPLIPTDAVRDAQLRVPETPYPVVFFSHGFGGTHSQSTDLTVHLASRGYVLETGTIVAEGPSAELRDDENLKKAYLGG